MLSDLSKVMLLETWTHICFLILSVMLFSLNLSEYVAGISLYPRSQRDIFGFPALGSISDTPVGGDLIGPVYIS